MQELEIIQNLNIFKVKGNVWWSISINAYSQFLLIKIANINFKIKCLNHLISYLRRKCCKLAGNTSKISVKVISAHGLTFVDKIQYMQHMQLPKCQNSCVWQTDKCIIDFGNMDDVLYRRKLFSCTSSRSRKKFHFNLITSKYSLFPDSHVNFVLD